MEYLRDVLIAAIAALPATITAYAVLRQGRKLIVKADEIHELTNSNLTTVKTDLILANQRIKELQDSITSLKR